ncbi:MAG: carotenoid oxygenase family protein [Actinomycetota bacterium]|nr:carotenoid oxygenase family protein [Actinomycetota bacterium]
MAVSVTTHRLSPPGGFGAVPSRASRDAYRSWRWRRLSAAEDDGWVLSYVYDGTRHTSGPVILEASDVTATPVATITLAPHPVRLPRQLDLRRIPRTSVMRPSRSATGQK